MRFIVPNYISARADVLDGLPVTLKLNFSVTKICMLFLANFSAVTSLLLPICREGIPLSVLDVEYSLRIKLFMSSYKGRWAYYYNMD